MKPLKELLKQEQSVIVDVRSQWEYEEEHIEGAQNIPLEELMYKVEELKSLHRPVVLYCQSGSRSYMALTLLRQYGLTDVYNGGGIGDMQTLVK